MTETATLGDALPALLQRSRASMLEFSRDARPGVCFVTDIIEAEMRAADRAMIGRDLSGMLGAYLRLGRIDALLQGLRDGTEPAYRVIDGVPALERALTETTA